MPQRTKEERKKAGLFPSRDVDLSTALELLRWSWYRFSRSTENLSPDGIREILEALEPSSLEQRNDGAGRLVERTRCAAIFLHTATDLSSDTRLTETWSAAAEALKIFESQYPWGSKRKAERLEHIRADSRLVEASRAAAVGSTVVPLELLAVLVMDGADASSDALLPHVERALHDEAELMPLSQICRFAAKTKAMTDLVRLVESRLAAARGNSPAMELASALEIASGKRFRVEVRLTGGGNVSFWVSIDSERPGPGFRGGVQWPNERPKSLIDPDGKPVCSLSELPQWLATSGKNQAVTWNFEFASARYLRGQRLRRFLQWLQCNSAR